MRVTAVSSRISFSSFACLRKEFKPYARYSLLQSLRGVFRLQLMNATPSEWPCFKLTSVRICLGVLSGLSPGVAKLAYKYDYLNPFGSRFMPFLCIFPKICTKNEIRKTSQNWKSQPYNWLLSVRGSRSCLQICLLKFFF